MQKVKMVLEQGRPHLVVLLMLSLLLIISGCASRTIDLYEYGIYKISMKSELEACELIKDELEGKNIYVSIGSRVSEPDENVVDQAEMFRVVRRAIVEGV